MRRQAKAGLAIGGILASGSAVVAMSVSLFAGSIVRPPAATATGLEPFDSCAQLLDWYVDHSIDEVGPFGWDTPIVALGVPPVAARREFLSLARDSWAAAETAAQTPGGAVDNSSTGTNVQETGVDEPDVAKTDGTLLVRVADGRRLEVSDVTGDRPRPLGSLPLDETAVDPELLLVGDHAVVVSGIARPVKLPPPTEGLRAPGRIALPTADETRVVDVDLSDPADPRVTRSETYSGRVLAVRQYGDVVRLVTSTGRPELPFVQPGKRPGNGPGNGLSAREATARNRQIVRESTIEQWLPTVVADHPGADWVGVPRPLVDCADVLHGRAFTGTDTIAVTGYHVDTPDERSTTAVTTAGDLVYSSADALYVAATRWPARSAGGAEPRWRGDGVSVIRPWRPLGTDVHAFDLTGAAATYAGSGHLDGTLRDRWSMDEHDGRLRLAVSWESTPGDGGADNGIVVLTPMDGRLVRTGVVRGLGPTEEIKAVRWFDDLAVVVTFRQTDPLYTVDLSDPARPRALGELKIPGFSSYLHPIGGDRLLALGSDVTKGGRDRGAQAALFDISDPTDPDRLAVAGFGPATDVAAAIDPRAFTWLPDRSAAITRIEDWRSGRARVEVVRVGADGSLAVRAVDRDGSGRSRALPLPDGRVVLVGEDVEIVDLDRPAADVR